MQELYSQSLGLSYRSNEFQSDRRTIVLVHGLSGSISAWLPFEKKWESKFNLLTVDLIGHGRSFKPRHYTAYSIDAHANAICQLLSELRIHRFVILSHSLGTLIALEILARNRFDIQSAIFLSPTYLLHSTRLAWLTKAFARAGAAIFGALPFDGKIRGRTNYLNFPNSGDWNVHRMWSDISNTSLRSYFYSFSQIYNFDDGPKWAAIVVPTLIVHGARDTLVPVQQSVLLNQLLPRSQLVVFQDSDHIIPLNKVAEICATAEEFMDTLKG